MPDKLTDLIRKMERSRQRLDTALEEAAPQMDIYPSWKVKQVMDHIAGWDELVYKSLRAYSRGEAPPSMRGATIDQYNEASVTARKELTLEQSRQAYAAERQKVLQQLRDLPPEMLEREYPAPWGDSCTIVNIVKIFVAHELEHARHIKETLQKTGE